MEEMGRVERKKEVKVREGRKLREKKGKRGEGRLR